MFVSVYFHVRVCFRFDVRMRVRVHITALSSLQASHRMTRSRPDRRSLELPTSGWRDDVIGDDVIVHNGEHNVEQNVHMQ